MNANLYTAFNNLQKNDAKFVLKELSDTFEWKENEFILDIGSGPGDVTANIIKPYSSKSSVIIGSDINGEMVNFANKKYSSDSLIFKTLDIQNNFIWDNWRQSSFDKIVSFYCLHWIKDKRQAIINIEALMKSGGEMLLVLLSNNPLYELFKMVASIPKWSPYIQDIDYLMSPLKSSKQPAEDLKALLESVHLIDVNVVEKERTFTYPSKEIMISSMDAVIPFSKKIPLNLTQAFLEDLEDAIPKHIDTRTLQDGSIEVHYKLLVARASKLNKDISYVA